jgi:hypothetical protein
MMTDFTSLERVSTRVLGALLLAAVAGCGNLTAGGATGEAFVVLSGDVPDAAQALASEVRGGLALGVVRNPAASSHDDSPEGEIEVELSLLLVAADGDLVPLTDADVRVRVDLEGVQESQIADQVVSSAQYTGLRLVFTEIEAEVDAGLIINGVPVTGAIRVELDDISLTFTKPLDLSIGDDQRVGLVIDLNAADWLQAVDPVTATVDPQVFVDFVTVSVR